MARGLFKLNIGLAEHIPTEVDIPLATVDRPIDVSSVIDEQINNDEIVEIVADMQEHLQVIDNGTDAVNQLNEQTQIHMDTIKDQPYTITEDTVALSQENLSIILGRLGYNIEDYNNIYRKHYLVRLAEENRANPITKLKIATEGIQEVIDNIIDKIKKAFKALVDMFQKLFLKMGVAFENTGKKADELLAKIDNAEIPTTLGDDMKEKLNERWKYVNILEGINDAVDFDKINRCIQSSAYALAETARKVKDPNFRISSTFTKPDFQAKKEYIPEGFTNSCVIKFIGKCKVLGCKDSTYEILPIKEEEVKKIDNFKIDKVKLKNGLTIASKNAKEIKNFINKVETIRKESEKVLNFIGQKPTNELSDVDRVTLSFVGKLGSTITLDVINNYRDFNKAIVATGNLLINKKEDKDDKQEKEKEDKEDKKKEEKEKDKKEE